MQSTVRTQKKFKKKYSPNTGRYTRYELLRQCLWQRNYYLEQTK